MIVIGCILFGMNIRALILRLTGNVEIAMHNTENCNKTPLSDMRNSALLRLPPPSLTSDIMRQHAMNIRRWPETGFFIFLFAQISAYNTRPVILLNNFSALGL